MSWVYAIAFLQDQFVMVYNPKRHGWEMPGGKIEKGEEPREAIIREVLEETGCEFEPKGSMVLRNGMVFTGNLSCLARKGEMMIGLFFRLPAPLSYPNEEYGGIIEWAQLVRRGKEA